MGTREEGESGEGEASLGQFHFNLLVFFFFFLILGFRERFDFEKWVSVIKKLKS